MRRYWQSWIVRIGLVLLIAGSGPLLLLLAAAKIGLWPDPDPNPVLLGILAGLTFWPGLLLTLIGVWRVRRQDASD